MLLQLRDTSDCDYRYYSLIQKWENEDASSIGIHKVTTCHNTGYKKIMTHMAYISMAVEEGGIETLSFRSYHQVIELVRALE